MIEATLYDKLADGQTRCRVCLWRCVIPVGGAGVCRTRVNQDGTLYSLIYGRADAVAADPVEKKPLYHFHPGTRVYSMGTVGCNFACPGCQNAQISRVTPAPDEVAGTVSPEEAVNAAIRLGCAGICWTYNEPAIWLEYTFECAKLAKERGLYTAYVTNGAATREHLDRIGPYLDAYRVDIKGFSAETYRKVAGFANYEAILDTTQYAKKRWKMHVECVTNVTPTINDRDDELRGIARWISRSLGPETPWHVTRFHPCDEFANLPATPIQKLERAYNFGKKEGLQFVYIGNVPGDARQDTTCPNCRRPVIRRHGISVAQVELEAGGCPKCHTPIAGIWR